MLCRSKGNSMFTYLVTIASAQGLKEEKMHAPDNATLKKVLADNKIVWTTIFKLAQVK